MSFALPGSRAQLLPLLLALPRGTVVGVSADPAPESGFPPDLETFGPLLQTESELRHAARNPPARLVIDLRELGTALLGAALPGLSRMGAVVVLYSDDCGMLARWADRILRPNGTHLRWVTSEAVRAERCLEFRVDCGRRIEGAWVRVPLSLEDGAEAILSAAMARGVRICESRIAYHAVPPR